MFKSVFLKYVTAFMLINILCMFILTIIITSLVTSYSTEVKTNTVSSAADFMSDFMYKKMDTYNMEDLRKYAGVYAPNLLPIINSMNINADDFIIMLADTSGNIFISGGGPGALKYTGEDGILPSGSERYRLPDGFMEELSEKSYVRAITDLDGIYDEEYIICAKPVYTKTGVLAGAIIAGSARNGMNTLLDSMVRSVVMSTLWLMLAVLVVVYFISERLIAPIRLMSRASKKFAKGQFDIRVPVRGNDEIAELSKAFNNMAASLANNEEMRRLFLANVSHDLRTPMTTISGFIDGILDGAIPPEKHEYYLEIIASEVRRLSRLVSSLLDITKIQAGERKFEMVSFDICEMCRQVLISSEQRIDSKNLDVEFMCDDDNMYAIGDTDAINQIVYNIMDNAIKFSRDGGKYSITVKYDGTKIVTSVYNEGVGISEDDLPYIFDRFYKSDKSRGLDKTGVGLGMYIARTIIEAHGENISCESEYGKWCRFTFTLPRGSAPKNQVPKMLTSGEHKEIKS